jgi:hypothetical protein
LRRKQLHCGPDTLTLFIDLSKVKESAIPALHDSSKPDSFTENDNRQHNAKAPVWTKEIPHAAVVMK